MKVYFLDHHIFSPEKCIRVYEATRCNENCVWLPEEHWSGQTIEVKRNRSSRSGAFFNTIEEAIAAGVLRQELRISAWLPLLQHYEKTIERWATPDFIEQAYSILPPGVSPADKIEGIVWRFNGYEIRPIRVVRVTASSIWRKEGIREKRHGKYDRYYDSLKECIQSSTAIMNDEAEKLGKQVALARGRLAFLEQLEAQGALASITVSSPPEEEEE